MNTKMTIIKILTSLTENEKVKDNLNDNLNFTDLGINSLIFLKLVVKLENEYNIIFSNEKLDYKNFSDIDDLAGYIDSIKMN